MRISLIGLKICRNAPIRLDSLARYAQRHQYHTAVIAVPVLTLFDNKEEKRRRRRRRRR